MALELEQENETLRSNLVEINLQRGSLSFRYTTYYTVPVNSHLLPFVHTEAQMSEIVEMLVQEGLAEVVSCSLSEQVAYLLADRAALMEKIQTLEDADSRTLNVTCTQEQRTPDENAEKVRLLTNVCYFIWVLKQCDIKPLWSWEPSRWHHCEVRALGSGCLVSGRLYRPSRY